MTEDEDRKTPEQEDKLDLAAVAEQLAARSREPRGEPALEPAPPEPAAPDPAEADEPEPDREPDEAAEDGGEGVGAALSAEGDGTKTEGPELTEGEHELSGAEVYAAVEALLFAADKPVSAAQIARALPSGINAREVRGELKAIQEELSSGERGFELREIAGGWQLFSRGKFAPYVAKLKKAAGARKLTPSALETLAVVAYKQPVTRAEVERIRGVACGDMLRSLMEKRLLRITGRSPELGNPLLYGTTTDFLDHFGLASVSDLPRSAELARKPKSDQPAVPPAGGREGGAEAAAAENGEGESSGEPVPEPGDDAGNGAEPQAPAGEQEATGG
jgi:segregation and condensation protein B